MDGELARAAAEVLLSHDSSLAESPPHQWSWDVAFVSIGLAHLSMPLALRGWNTLFGAQWTTGMLPHIVFADEPDYFPGFGVWGTAVAEARPDGVETSGICHPPVHALCAEHVVRIGRARGGESASAAEAFLADAVPRLARWHAWLTRARDREGLGILEIHHGWESGMDNSPRFDPFYGRIAIPDPKVLPRTDLKYADPAERPTDREYQRYIWLIDQMIGVGFDDDLIPDVVDLRCGDVFMTACLAASCEALARMADDLGDRSLAATERGRAARARAAVLGSVDPRTGLCRDYDYHESRFSDVVSIASFSALVCGGDDTIVSRQRAILTGTDWMGHPGNRYPLPGSVSLEDRACRPREHWRGPVWPIMTWLLADAALGRGDDELARRLRSAGLEQLADLRFGEFYEPSTGEALGRLPRPWTAMVALDWLSAERWR